MTSELTGHKARIIEIDGKTIGNEDGETCNRLVDIEGGESYMCDGIIELEEGKDCSCHISPPCNSCMDRQFVCNGCGACPADEE